MNREPHELKLGNQRLRFKGKSNEVERVLRDRIASYELDGLNALELEYQRPGQTPLREAQIRQHREWCERQVAALTHALRCVVAMRGMEERRVWAVDERGGWIAGEWRRYPTPLEALEAAMAAVKGESGGE